MARIWYFQGGRVRVSEWPPLFETLQLLLVRGCSVGRAGGCSVYSGCWAALELAGARLVLALAGIVIAWAQTDMALYCLYCLTMQVQDPEPGQDALRVREAHVGAEGYCLGYCCGYCW